MEAIGKNYDRSLKKSINRTFSSTPCENLAPINYQNGILRTPILYHSFPPFLAHQKQPPLLPLPISKSSVTQHYNNNHANTLSQNRAFSLPPTNRKFIKSKKSNPKPKSSKVAPLVTTSDKIETVQRKSSEVVIGSSTNPLDPDPKDLPKDVSTVLSMSSSTGVKEQSTVIALSSRYAQNPVKVQSVSNARNPMKNDVDSFVVFNTVSPPPSSLPLPTFSLRPKLRCNAEASAGVDTGATDNLRRLLKLR